MKIRTKIAASGLIVAALVTTAMPAFAAGNHKANKAAVVKMNPTTSQTSMADQARPRHGGPLATLVTAGTITQAQADAVETATHTAFEAAHVTQMNAALAALVANGTITQAVADAAKASMAANTADPHHADLSTWTAAQRTALRTWLDANPVDRAAIAKAELAKLVTAGTITQAQSDAIATALASMPPKGPRGDGAADNGGPGKGGKGHGHGRGHGHGDGDGDHGRNGASGTGQFSLNTSGAPTTTPNA